MQRSAGWLYALMPFAINFHDYILLITNESSDFFHAPNVIGNNAETGGNSGALQRQSLFASLNETLVRAAFPDPLRAQ
jgi:hypothetical protein